MEGEDQVGVVTGLAWTEVGGDTLKIESVMVPGKGRLQTTGKLGDVMKESIDAARSYVRSKATTFGIKPPIFDHKDIHVHVPEGATPKDGPSAGRGHGDLDHLGADRYSGAPRCGDDGRNHPARPGAADRRLEGEAAGGAARRASRP